MQPGPVTFARLQKALRHRWRRLGRRFGGSTPRPAVQFESLAALREHARTATGAATRYRYQVRLATPISGTLNLRIGRLARVEIAAAAESLTVDAAFTEAMPEGAFAWAVATLAQPGLRPLANHSPDIEAASAPDAALLMGGRNHFGPFAGSDASEMESAQARRVTAADLAIPYFDLATFNPIGLRLRELGGSSIADVTVGRSVQLNGTHLPTDERLVAALRSYSGARVNVQPDASAGLLAGVAATGLVLQADRVPAGLSPELAELLGAPLPPSGQPEHLLHWLARSERQRRAAIVHHAGAFRLGGPPPVSVLLVTNRLGLLPAALLQVAAQGYPQFEVLVGLHGIPKAEAAAALAAELELLGDRVRLVEFDASEHLGAVYGSLTTQAAGLYLAKFDDDDYYGPNHLWDALMSLRYSGAGLFGRTPTMTWLNSTGELLLRPFGAEETYNKYIIGATMVIEKAALNEVGGWRPSPWAVDKALIDRFATSGGGTYRAGQLGWVYVRHDQGHTWLRDESHFRNQAEAVWQGDDALRLRQLVLQAD